MDFVNSYEDFNIHIPSDAKANSTGNVYVKCPICSSGRKKHNAPCLGVKIEEGMWGCSHCSFSGHLITEDFIKANNIQIHSDNTVFLPENIVSWFATRKISKETLFRSRVAFESMMMLQVKTPIEANKGKYVTQDCIAFRCFKNGLLRNIKYRDRYKNFRLMKGGELIFYNIDNIKGTSEAFVVEGEIDCLSLCEIGYWNTVSVPNGATISEEEKNIYETTGELKVISNIKLEYLDKDWESFKDKKVIYIGTDNDAPGLKLREELGRRLRKDRCKILKFDLFEITVNNIIRKCKDANEVLLHHGENALQFVIDNAEPFPVNDVILIDKLKPELLTEYMHGSTHGIDIQIPSMKEHFSIVKGHTLLINGYPSNGKTSFMCMLVMLMSIEYEWKWGIYSPENYPVSDIVQTLLEIYTGKPFDKRYSNRMTSDEMEQALDFVKKHIFFVNNEDGYTPEGLRTVTKQMIYQFGIDGFITDPWNSLIHNGEDNINAYLGRELSFETRLAVNNKIFKIINAHPNTPPKDKDKEYKAPGTMEVSGGIMWYNKMYEILCVHRQNSNDFDNTNTEIHIQKVKSHKQVGVPTLKGQPIILKYVRRNNRYIQEDDFDPIEEAKNRKYNTNLKFEGF